MGAYFALTAIVLGLLNLRWRDTLKAHAPEKEMFDWSGFVWHHTNINNDSD